MEITRRGEELTYSISMALPQVVRKAMRSPHHERLADPRIRHRSGCLKSILRSARTYDA